MKLIGRVKYKPRPIVYEVYREDENGKIWVILHPDAPVTEYCQEAYASLEALKTVLVIQGRNWEFEEGGLYELSHD